MSEDRIEALRDKATRYPVEAEWWGVQWLILRLEAERQDRATDVAALTARCQHMEEEHANRIVELTDACAAAEARALQAEQARDALRVALIGLVGANTRAELEQMEAAIRATAAPAADKAASIDAIHALLATQA